MVDLCGRKGGSQGRAQGPCLPPRRRRRRMDLSKYPSSECSLHCSPRSGGIPPARDVIAVARRALGPAEDETN